MFEWRESLCARTVEQLLVLLRRPWDRIWFTCPVPRLVHCQTSLNKFYNCPTLGSKSDSVDWVCCFMCVFVCDVEIKPSWAYSCSYTTCPELLYTDLCKGVSLSLRCILCVSESKCMSVCPAMCLYHVCKPHTISASCVKIRESKQSQAKAEQRTLKEERIQVTSFYRGLTLRQTCRQTRHRYKEHLFTTLMDF